MNLNLNTHAPRRTFARHLVGIAVLFGALLAAMGVVNMPHAGAATPRTGLLYVYKSVTPGEHCFKMDGYIPMTQYDAQGFINNGAMIATTMWGDDPSYDDLLIGPVWGDGNYAVGRPAMHSSTRGLEATWWTCTPSSTLDEDWGGDELYVDVSVYGGGGYGLIGYFETHRVNGNY